MGINPKFILNKPSSEKETSIKFYFYLNRDRFTYSLGPDKKILPSLWNKSTMRPEKLSKKELSQLKKINPSIEVDLNNIENRIKNVISHTNKFISNAEIQGEKFDIDELKAYLNNQFGIIRKIKDNTNSDNLETYLTQVREEMESGIRLIKTKKGEGKRYRKGTIKAYKVLESKLEEYRKHKKKRYLKFNDINIDFYNDFQQYIYSKNFTPNYFGNFIKNLKVIMRLSLEENLHSNTSFQLKAFAKTSNESTSIYLTQSELNKIQKHKFKEHPHLEKYRDIFLLGCWTAQRFSDYTRYNKDFLKDKDGLYVLEFNQVKENVKVIIPLSPDALKILKKYKYQLPEITEPKMNEALKLIGEKVKINELVELRKIKGGMESTTMVPKYKLITSHTARRTGCTLMYLNKIPTIDIMKISGHKSESQLLKYIKVSKDETAQRLSMNPFFSGTKMKVV